MHVDFIPCSEVRLCVTHQTRDVTYTSHAKSKYTSLTSNKHDMILQHTGKYIFCPTNDLFF